MSEQTALPGFIDAPPRRWQHEQVGPADVRHFALRTRDTAFWPDLVAAVTVGDLVAADAILRDRLLLGAGVVVAADKLLAFVDHVRSIPLFFDRRCPGRVSNDARALLRGGERVDVTGVLEMQMAGYVSGWDTVVADIGQIQAGGRLFAVGDQVDAARYWTYRHAVDHDRSEADFAEELHHLLDQAMRRTVVHAAGRPIWAPLSGGLDSRLIVAKLHQLGYDNLNVFSYGPSGNWEARHARRVANRLGLDWFLLPSTRADYRAFFHSPERREYWRFADNLSSLPNPQDILPLLQLRRAGRLSDDAVIVNGQSGDFITGGHILPPLRNDPPGQQTLANTVVGKHYSLWKSMVTAPNLDVLTAKMWRTMGLEPGAPLTRAEMMDHYESWEYSERQAKFVVHGQRIYDFLGLDWDLPLWDFDLARFFQTVPVELKFGQHLYRRVLREWDWKGLFSQPEPNIWRWPGASILAVPTARVVGAVMGAKAKQRFYQHCMYWGHTRQFYAPYGWAEFRRTCHDARHGLALDTRCWLQENSSLWSGRP